MVIGVAIAVGAHPFDDPSPFGALLKAFADSSNAGLALRSVGRAVPLVALCATVLLGTGVTAFVRWLDRRNLDRYALVTVGLVAAIVIAALPALWNGDYYGKNLQRPEAIPNYWTRAINAVDARPHDTRILEMPGSDFASYRWGNTVDPITPGLTDRPYVARELIPYGTPETNDLLNALDGRIQRHPPAFRPAGRPVQPRAPEADGAAPQSTPAGDRRADRLRHQPRPAARLPAARREGAGAAGRHSQPAAGRRVPGQGRAADRPGPACFRPVARGRWRRRPGRHRGPRHARREQPRPVLGVVCRQPGRAPHAGRHRWRHPRRHRLEPAPRPAVEHGPRERGVHGTAGREAARARPVRRPTRRLSRRG